MAVSLAMKRPRFLMQAFSAVYFNNGPPFPAEDLPVGHLIQARMAAITHPVHAPAFCYSLPVIDVLRALANFQSNPCTPPVRTIRSGWVAFFLIEGNWPWLAS
ncbi:hypothetical protein [Rhizobium sp. 007]|uniref:hypothetical protein n=1 Tax=Rhizobium sp. 007 TaxID=2785056 RepID=UPI00188F954E|nr:hypothetical protein [Rhizobium sp. 007]QPB20386.1 hypothetical protein ISN39_02390 [Rhizobium sp. 007]